MMLPSIDYFLDTPPRKVIFKLQRLLVSNRTSSEDTSNINAIFCLSTGRTGTKTLAALFSHSKELLTYHEPKPNLFGMSCASYINPEIVDSNFAQSSFLAVRSENLDLAMSIGRGLIETSPQVTFLAPIIASVLPQSKFIHIVRHPADVIRSGMRRNWFNGHKADSTRIIPRMNTEDATKWDEWSPFEKNCWLWNETNRWIMDFRSTISRERSYLLKSEDIYAGNQTVFDDLCKFISAKPPSASYVNKIINKKLNVQKGGSFPYYHDWSSKQKIIIHNMVGPLANQLGYELEDV
jgi:hypothetical protein